MRDWDFRPRAGWGPEQCAIGIFRILGAAGTLCTSERRIPGAEMGTPPGPQKKRSRPQNEAPAVIRATFPTPRRLSTRLQSRSAILTGEVRGMGVSLNLHETRAFARKIPRAGWEPEE